MVGPEYTGEFLFPQALRLVESSAQGPEDDSIGCLYLVVGFKMHNKGDKVLNAQPCHEVFIGLSFELGVIVDDNGVWEAIPAYEVFPSELHLIGHNFSQWSCLDPLGEVINYY